MEERALEELSSLSAERIGSLLLKMDFRLIIYKTAMCIWLLRPIGNCI
jgi:hypothetical protein